MKWSKNVLVCGLLAAVTLAAYWPLFRNDFINFDDHHYVVDNPHVLNGLSWANVKWAFTTGYSSNWHPLTWISHQIDVQLFGLRPGWHHAESLLFHIANTLLLFMVLRKMTRLRPTSARQAGLDESTSTDTTWRCAMVAALFAVHPLHVESVAWAAERKDVLSTFFFMLTLLCYSTYAARIDGAARINDEIRRTKSEGNPKPETRNPDETRFPWRYYALALFFFTCGLMSKPMLVTTPFVLLLLDFWPLKRFQIENLKSKIKNLLLEKIPFLALCVASSIVTFLVQQGGGSASTMEGLPLEPRVTNAILSYLKYLGKTFWPADLAIFYPHPGIRGPAGEAPGWLVGIAALLLIAVSVSALLQMRKEPWLTTGWFWFLGTLVPVIGIVQVGYQAMADRYTYIPLIGLFIAFVWWAADLVASHRSGPAALKLAGVTAVATCAVLTQRQVKYWRSNFILFEHALAVTKENGIAHYLVGVELWSQGKSDLAISHFRSALDADPNYADAYSALGFSFVKLGKPAEAEQSYRNLVRLRPDDATPHLNLAEVLGTLGRRDEAAQELKEAIRLKPEVAEPHRKMGILLSAAGNHEEAVAQFAEAARLKPGNPEVLSSLGGELLKLGRFGEAATNFAEAVRLKPDYADAHLGLGRSLVLEGKLDGAARELEQTVRLRPDSTDHYELGMVRVMQGNAKAAITSYEQAVRLNPDSIPALNDLAWLLATDSHAELRNGAEAVRLAGHARDLSGGKTARFWGTLDAAYAEAGRWPDAIQAAQKAKELALGAGEKELAEAAEKRLVLYAKRQPYRSGN